MPKKQHKKQIRWYKYGAGHKANIPGMLVLTYAGDEAWCFEVWKLGHSIGAPPTPGADGVAPDKETARRWAIEFAAIISNSSL